MPLLKGNKVLVKAHAERFSGKTGTVLVNNSTDDPYEITVVIFEGDGVGRGLFAHELELVVEDGPKLQKIEIELAAEDSVTLSLEATEEQVAFLERIAAEANDLQETLYPYAPSMTVKRVKDNG